MKKFTVFVTSSLKDFTAATYPQGSFCLAALLRSRDIKVNGVRTGRDMTLYAGDEVTYYTTPKQESLKSHNVIYEDENVLVADKYDGVETAGLLSELKEKGEYFAVHRLDRNTKGLIIFAKNRAAEEELSAAFKEGRIHKVYRAMCKNNFKKDSAVMTAYLKKDADKSEVKIFDKETAGAVKIVTEYGVLHKFGDVALVKVTLHTGKTHQIRAHMAHIGCPVLGDEKYGDGALNKKYRAKRQCLVSYTLGFDLKGGLEYLNKITVLSGFEP